MSDNRYSSNPMKRSGFGSDDMNIENTENEKPSLFDDDNEEEESGQQSTGNAGPVTSDEIKNDTEDEMKNMSDSVKDMLDRNDDSDQNAYDRMKGRFQQKSGNEFPEISGTESSSGRILNGDTLSGGSESPVSSGAKSTGKSAGKAAGKTAGKAAGKSVGKAVVSWIVAHLPVILLILGIIAIILFLVMALYTYSETEDEEGGFANNNSSEYADSETILSNVFYSKYSDQSYYFMLSEPEEAAASEELEYSGKTYEQLGGEKDRGLTQSSTENYIKDVDGYEDNVKINRAVLETLDQYLNDGYAYPEQFLKAVYTGDSCDLTSEDLDIRTCQLGDITEAESTAYEKNLNGQYIKTEEKEISVSDYGLGSLVHYQAYFQPSRIADYKIDKVTYVNEEWDFDKDGDSTPLNSGYSWSSLDESEKETILEKYKYKTNTFSSSVSEGLLDNGETGIYDVEDEIVYKDWAAAFYSDEESGTVNDYDTIYTSLDWDLWASSDPLISTGLADTTIAYAIDHVTAFYGSSDLTVSQRWMTRGEATHTQTGTYIKNYTSSKAGNHNTYTVNSFENAEGLKLLYVNGNPVGYIKDDPVWNKGHGYDSGTDYAVTEQIQNDEAYCEGYKGTGNGENYKKCIEGTHTSGFFTVYSSKFDSGYWEYTIVMDLDGNRVNITEQISPGEDASYDGMSKSDYESVLNKDPDSGKESGNVSWYYQPAYVFSISAVTKGEFQTRYAYHLTDKISTSTDSVRTYIDNYIENYTAYIADDNNVLYNCYESSSSDIPEALPTDVTTDIEQVSTKQCEPDGFAMKPDSQEDAVMKWSNDIVLVELENIPETHRKKIMWLLGTDDEFESSNNVEVTEDTVSVLEGKNTEIRDGINNVIIMFEEDLDKYSEKYGVDRNLLATMIYTKLSSDGISVSNAESVSNLTGVKCDAGNCRLSDVTDYSTAWETKEDLLISSSCSQSDSIRFAAAKMQKLLERYEGNVIVSLLAYDIGTAGADKVLEIYEDETSIPVEATILSLYDSGWYHYVKYVTENASELGISLSSNAGYTYVGDVIGNSVYSSVYYWKSEDRQTLWSATSVYDNEAEFISKRDYNEEDIEERKMDSAVISNLYRLKRNNSEKFREYWEILFLNQKSWDSGNMMDENGIYSPESSLPETARIIKSNFSKSYAEEITDKAFLSFVDIERDDIEKLNPSAILRGTGESITGNSVGFEEDYEDVFGSEVSFPADIYETDDSSKAWVWKINTEEGEDIYAIMSGYVGTVGDDSIEVWNEDGTVVVKYYGVYNMTYGEDTVDWTVSAGDILGISLGEVSITAMRNGYYEDVESLMDSYLSSITADAANYSNYLVSVMPYFSGSILSTKDMEDLWNAMKYGGYFQGTYYPKLEITGAYPRQCVQFVNYMVQLYWGSDFYPEAVSGHGYQKVDVLKKVYGNALVTPTDTLPNDGKNIAYSWAYGEYGHTGWINECHYDPNDSEGHGYVIVSQGNIQINGVSGNIQWQYKMTWDEWQRVYPNGTARISYVWKR